MTRRKSDDPGQLALLPHGGPDLDEAEVRALVKQALKRRSRPIVADHMGISPAVLDAFTADSKERYRLPVSFLVRFCRATGDLTIIYKLCGALQVPYHRDPAEATYAELGRLQVQREEATAREEELKRQLYKRQP